MDQFDARRNEEGWDEPSFEPSSKWSAAVAYPKSADLGPLSLFTTPPIRVTESRSPVKIYESPKPDVGGPAVVFDFGQNWAGVATLRLGAAIPAGTVLTLRYTEIVHKDGGVFNTYCGKGCNAAPWAGTMTGNCANQTDTYTSTGTAGESWTPRFTYHGFRFVSIEGLPVGYAIDNSTLTSHFVHSDTPVIGHIHFTNSSMAILNKIQTAILYTQGSNMHTIPTDCCQREKRGWMGDAQWTSEEAALNFDVTAFYENFVRTFADTQAVGCNHVAAEVLNRRSFPPGQSRPPTYECCSRQKPTFGCDWTGTNDSFIDARGSLPDVCPYVAHRSPN